MDTNRARYQTRTEATVANYLKRADSLLSRIADEMQLPDDAYPAPDDVVAYMQRHASEWKWATFRQYQASLVCRYELEFEKSLDPIFNTTADALRKLPYGDCKPEKEIGRTSSRKRKGVLKRDYDVLVANLANPKFGGDYSKRAALWLMAATASGLRPCEWQHAHLLDDESGLEVRNAKATNGRGTGPSRVIPLQSDDVPVVRAHLASIRELMATGRSFVKIHDRCGEALRRACESIWGNDTDKRYALYSGRHQFAANHKAIMTSEQVAQLLGHRSTRTARRHYAPRRSAWPKFQAARKLVLSNDPAPKPNM